MSTKTTWQHLDQAELPRSCSTHKITKSIKMTRTINKRANEVMTISLVTKLKKLKTAFLVKMTYWSYKNSWTRTKKNKEEYKKRIALSMKLLTAVV